MTAYRPFDRSCVRGVASWGEVNRRRTGGTRSRTSAALFTSSARGRTTSTSRGIRSWSRSSVASTIGSAWKRATMAPSLRHVAESDQGHPLVMGHVAADDGDRRTFGEPSRRVVERFPEPVGAGRSGIPQAREVPHRGLGPDHRPEGGRVRGDDHVLAQAALEAQPGHPEPGVLVGLRQVPGVEPGFGHAPRHAELGPVAHLPCHDQLVRLVEQAARRGPHHQGGHQVLEHRPGPRHQGGAAADRREHASEPEPVVGGDVPPGDRDEAGEPGLGGEQVVVARVQRALADAEPDREQLAGRVEQEAEVHLPEQAMRAVGDRLEAPGKQHRIPGSIPHERGRRVRELADRREGRHRLPCAEQGEVPFMAGDREARCVRPGHELSGRTLTPLGRERRGHIRQDPGARGEGRDAVCPGVHRRGDLLVGAIERRERLLEVAPGEGLTLPVVADRLGGLPGKRDGVTDPLERRRHGERLVDHLATRAGEGEQVAGEVAAVDGRHVRGLERVQVPRVVPVVQVPAIPLEALDRRERRLETLDHLHRADPAEVACGHGRQEVQADVGRRRAVRDRRSGVILEVVRRQPVVVRPDERLEEPPRQAGDAAQRVLVRRGEPVRDRFGRGKADPAGDDG